ncbi:MAG TPA: radical SAM protein [Polyangia bacterium]
MVGAAPEPRLKQVTLVLTERCNQRCGYCYVPTDRGRTMPDEVARAGVDLLFAHAARVGTVSFSFFGGEPFLEAGLMRRVAAAAAGRRRLGQRVGFGTPTNATALDDEALAVARDLRMELAVSLDGEGSERRFAGGGSAEDAARFGIRRLLGLPLAGLTARLTVTPGNVGHLAANVARTFALGLTKIVYLPAYEAAWDAAAVATWRAQHEELAGWLLARARARTPNPELPSWRGILARLDGAPRRHCGAGVTQVTVATDGAIYPCYRTAFDPARDRAVLGHVAQGLAYPERWAAHAALDPQRPQPAAGSCASCDAAGGCTFFCPALGHLLLGDIGRVPAVACELMRAQVAAARACGAQLQDRAAPRGPGLWAAAAMGLFITSAAAGCGDRALPGPDNGDGPIGGVCPVQTTDAGVQDGQIGGVCQVDGSRPADAPLGGVCPVYIDAGQSDMMVGGVCAYQPDGPVGGVCPAGIC